MSIEVEDILLLFVSEYVLFFLCSDKCEKDIVVVRVDNYDCEQEVKIKELLSK